MDSKEFRQRGREMVDYIADYLENIENRRVLPEVQPGYLRDMLPKHAPQVPDSWDDVMKDVERCIMPGMTHWQHPHFHGFFPSNISYPSILGDLLSAGFSCVGFTWASCPSLTELELIVLDWMAKMMNLPEIYLNASGIGIGVLQGSASECVFISMLVARHKTLKQLSTLHPHVDEGVLLSKLVAYCSKLAHSCVEKAGMLSLVKMRELDIDDNYSLRGSTLEQAIQDDRKKGLIPFYVNATLGTTAVCSYDNLKELGKVSEKYNMWLHVDAAYAGCAFVCPEFRNKMDGIEYVHSLNVNLQKMLLVNLDCSILWMYDKKEMINTMHVDPFYLRHPNSDRTVDLRNYGISLGRRFRALKLWFVLRSYGVTGLQKHIRNYCRLAKYFESLMSADPRFQIIGEVTLGLVCFKLKERAYFTQVLFNSIEKTGKLLMVPAIVDDSFIIRFTVCYPLSQEHHIRYAWYIIRDMATSILKTSDDDLMKTTKALNDMTFNIE